MTYDNKIFNYCNLISVSKNFENITKPPNWYSLYYILGLTPINYNEINFQKNET